MLQHLRTTLTNAMVRASAPLVAAVFLLVSAVRAQYSTRGPKVRFWSRIRRRYLPSLDRLARSLDVGYAAYELGHREYAGTLRVEPREAERVLYRHGFRRNPFAAFKTLPDGRREFSSWCYRPSLLATRQVHVMLFDRPGRGTDLYAHAEYSSINPLVANKHYDGEGYDPTRGQARLHERLPQDAWMASVGPNETPAAADVDATDPTDATTSADADASADAEPDSTDDTDAPADTDSGTADGSASADADRRPAPGSGIPGGRSADPRRAAAKETPFSPPVPIPDVSQRPDVPAAVDAVIPEFADAFPFDEFNRMQREALPALLDTDDNVVASAPTASGKTALAELAICRTLRAGGTALFIAPMRALTNEKETEWERFEDLGYSVYVVTGERDLHPRRAERADILVMTPEKADSATRKHESSRYGFVTDVDCVVIDEVHLLDSDRRGSVLEVTISRLRRLCDPRIVALSATMPNVEDVAEWLDAPDEATFAFGDEYRPVDLRTGVKTYTHGENTFADKYRRLYRAIDLAEPHIRDGGQTLVFVASRQDSVMAARKARDVLAERDVPMGARGDFDFHQDAQELGNDTLRQSVLDGVAFHHAGLAKADRDRVEAWFRAGQIQLLFSTSTLAWGVNLPARCVVIRDTKYHDPLEGEVDMSPLDVLQMLGRAGRPGYDDVGHGWVVCDRSEADKYRRLLREGTDIESTLAGDLASHLNAEIAMGTIADLADVVAWLETTYYYVRAKSEPEAYDFDGLRERVRGTVEDLVAAGFVETDDEGGVAPSTLGRLASKYYLRLETARRFRRLADRDRLTDDDVLEAVAGAAEFDSVSARQAETDAVDQVLGDRATDLENGHRKVLAILHAAARGQTPADLRSDAWVITQNALRLVSALREFLDRFAGARAANLARRVEARVEHGVGRAAVPLTAIDGVGAGRAETLVGAGIESPAEVVDAGADELARAGLAESVAERVVEQARELPRIEVEWGEFPEAIAAGENEMTTVTVRTVGGGARAGVRVTVNGVEMHGKSTYLSDVTTVPAAVFGADDDELEFTVEVTFPELPLLPFRESRIVRVE